MAFGWYKAPLRAGNIGWGGNTLGVQQLSVASKLWGHVKDSWTVWTVLLLLFLSDVFKVSQILPPTCETPFVIMVVVCQDEWFLFSNSIRESFRHMRTFRRLRNRLALDEKARTAIEATWSNEQADLIGQQDRGASRTSVGHERHYSAKFIQVQTVAFRSCVYPVGKLHTFDRFFFRNSQRDGLAGDASAGSPLINETCLWVPGPSASSWTSVEYLPSQLSSALKRCCLLLVCNHYSYSLTWIIHGLSMIIMDWIPWFPHNSGHVSELSGRSVFI